jgi:predicted transcriptional regulator
MIPLGLKIDESLKSKLSQVAKRTDRSVSAVARIAIEEGLVFFEKGVIHPSKKKLGKVSSTQNQND